MSNKYSIIVEYCCSHAKCNGVLFSWLGCSGLTSFWTKNLIIFNLLNSDFVLSVFNIILWIKLLPLIVQIPKGI